MMKGQRTFTDGMPQVGLVIRLTRLRMLAANWDALSVSRFTDACGVERVSDPAKFENSRRSILPIPAIFCLN